MSRAVALVLVALLPVFAGCSGLGGPAGTDAPTTDRTVTTEAPTTTGEPCTEHAPEYDVETPEKPSSLNRTAAVALATDFEERYRRARLSAEFGDVSIDQLTVRESAREIGGGYEVNTTIRVAFTADGNHGDGTFDATYRVTERRFVRDGRTLACWGDWSS